MLVKASQSPKAYPPISVNDVDNLTLDKFEQAKNAAAPIYVTVFGITMDDIPVFLKASAFIFCKVFGKTTLFILVKSLNTFLPITDTVYPPIVFGIVNDVAAPVYLVIVAFPFLSTVYSKSPLVYVVTAAVSGLNSIAEKKFLTLENASLEKTDNFSNELFTNCVVDFTAESTSSAYADKSAHNTVLNIITMDSTKLITFFICFTLIKQNIHNLLY